LSLKPRFAELAQEVYDAWEQQGKVYTGGICPKIAGAILREINNHEPYSRTDFTTIGRGSGHFVVVTTLEGEDPDHPYRKRTGFLINIPEKYYEIRHKYSPRGATGYYEKIPDVKFNASMVEIHKVRKDNLPDYTYWQEEWGPDPVYNFKDF